MGPYVGKCVRATYTKEGDNVGVLNEFIDETGYNNIKGQAHLADPNDPMKRGELIVDFGYGPTSVKPNYSVISTDYTSYSVVYPCHNILYLKYESLWLLTREKFPPTEAVETATEVMKANNLPIDKLEKTEQTGCELPDSST